LPPPEVSKRKYNEWLKQKLGNRYDDFQDEHVSCLDADIIPLDLLPYDQFLKLLAAKEDTAWKKRYSGLSVKLWMKWCQGRLLTKG